VSRCIALAAELRDGHGCTVVFAMRGVDTAGASSVRGARFEVARIAAGGQEDYGEELLDLVASRGAAALVVDVRDALSRASLDRVRARGIRVVVIDDGSERRLASDLAFYPPVPHVEQMNWNGFSGRRCVGWGWVLLNREFATDAFTPSELSESSPAIDVLVTMGGSDPAGMTEWVVESLESLPMPLAVCVVVGPAVTRAERLASSIAGSMHSVRIARGPASLAPLMRASRMAVAAFGVTAYELAACGVPAVHLCLTADDADASRIFEREGAAVTAGVFGEVTREALAEAVRRMMSAAGRRGVMAKRASQLVDGRGAARAAALVAAGLS
jgi:spore coat polysaccharide biosynthesis protein SpsF